MSKTKDNKGPKALGKKSLVRGIKEKTQQTARIAKQTALNIIHTQNRKNK